MFLMLSCQVMVNQIMQMGVTENLMLTVMTPGSVQSGLQIPIDVNQFTEGTGPTHPLPVDADELDFLFYFWNDGMFELIAAETNRYAQQKIEASGRPDALWYPTKHHAPNPFLEADAVSPSAR